MSGAADLGWVRSDRLAEWLGHGVSLDLVTRMRGTARLDRRLAHLAEARLGPVPVGAPGAVVLAFDELSLLGLALQAGAVWHARRIARVIDGEGVRQLVAAIGPALRLFAIRHVALAPADLAAEPGAVASVNLEALPAAIAGDGMGCLCAWVEAAHPALQQRLTFRLPEPGGAVDAFRSAGPGIIEALLGAAS